ncbi:trypsin, alkaline C-like [Anticarsia gemmatalis]|uniref:trypsin, alkaline C-like n=1 Tax=Anticarsia gemmatalis TaxID=129554 RepID=UPI003F76A2C0
MRFFILFAVCIAAVAAAPYTPQRIVGGWETHITRWPEMVALLYSRNFVTYWQYCGGSVLNNRSVLTATHCVLNHTKEMWRFRVGSTNANSGGVVHILDTMILHPDYDFLTMDNDVAILRSTTTIIYNESVRPARIAGPNYFVPDNAVVWAIGWGAQYLYGASTEILREVKVWTINLQTCKDRYAVRNRTVTDNMLCSGWLDVGGRDQCQGDSGGPLYHDGVVVGICSWGFECGLATFPGVNTRVSSYTAWIVSNA